jgi:nucleoid DNA-binding protein
MTRKMLAVKIANEIGIPKYFAKDIIGSVLNGILDSLVKGERVELRNFGVFSVRQRKQRVIRNPKTKEMVRIPEMKVVRFKPGREMKRKVA